MPKQTRICSKSTSGGEELTVEEIKGAIRKSTIANTMVPVVCGTSYRNKGVQKLLDAIVDYMPSPLDIPPIKGIDPELPEGENETVRPFFRRRAFLGSRVQDRD